MEHRGSRLSETPISENAPKTAGQDIGRRRFLGYLVAAPTLAAAAQLGQSAAAPEADAAIPSAPDQSEIYDLNDLLTIAATPTSNLIAVVINKDGTASFDMPRAESGQGITTIAAMLIAEELELPLDKINVTLADARPELLFNQFTAASNTAISMYNPIRVAAAIARTQLLEAAAIQLDETIARLTPHLGFISAPDGRKVGYGELAERAASRKTKKVDVTLKNPSEFTVIGTPRNRIDALEAVTGRKKFAMDLDAADDDLPPADDQGHPGIGGQRRRRAADAGRHPRRPDRHRRRRAREDVRPVHRRRQRSRRHLELRHGRQ